MENNRKSIKNVKILHYEEFEQGPAKTRIVAELIEYNEGLSKILQGKQILEGDIKKEATITNYVYDGNHVLKSIYHTKFLSGDSETTTLHIEGHSGCASCGKTGKTISRTVTIQNKYLQVSNASDPSLECDICKAIADAVCELLAEGIPEDEICLDVCGSVCSAFVETIVGFILCIGICATVCSTALDIAIKYGCHVGSDYICQKAGYCS